MLLRVASPTPIGKLALNIVNTIPFVLRSVIDGWSEEYAATLVKDEKYLDEKDKEVLNQVRDGVENGPGFVLIAGSRGLGKTTLLRAIQFIHEKIGRQVIYTAPDILRREVGSGDVLNRLKEYVDKFVENDHITLIIDDFPEFVISYKSREDELIDILGKLLERVIRPEETKNKVFITIQTELLQSFIDFWIKLEQKYESAWFMIHQQRRLSELIEGWCELIGKLYETKGTSPEDELSRLLIIFKIKTRRGLFIDLDAIWAYLKNSGYSREIVRRFIYAVNDYNISLERGQLERLITCVEYYWKSSSITREIIIPAGNVAVKKVVEDGGGANLRGAYNWVISKRLEEAEKYIQSVNEELHKLDNVSVFDIDISSLINNIYPLLKPLELKLRGIQIIPSYRVEVKTSKETEKSKGKTKKVDLVIAYKTEPLCLFVAVSAKPRYTTGSKGKTVVSVSIPPRIRDILANIMKSELERAYIIFFVYNNDVAQRVERLALKYKIPQLTLESPGDLKVTDGPAYGIVKLSQLERMNKEILKRAKLLADGKLNDEYIARGVLNALMVEPLNMNLVTTIGLIYKKLTGIPLPERFYLAS